MNKIFSKLPALMLTLVVGALASSSALGQANIVIENADPVGVGFNDTTAATPVGGNPGTTIGEQRLNAFQRAATIWGATLPGGPTITVRASWDSSLTCEATSGTLGSAGSIGIFRNFPNAPQLNTWYGSALANTLAGSDLDPANPEIRARFNPDIGTAANADTGTSACLQNSHWYYGFDTTHVFGRINLVTVLLHEFAHGLGFQTFTNSSTGVRPGGAGGFPSAYDFFLFDNTTNKNWTQMTDAERMASAINTGNLVWNGPQVTGDATLLSSGKDAQGRPLMRAPNPVQGGSSVSHWDTVATPNQLMEPNITSGLSHSVTTPADLTFSLLSDIGWCGSNCPPAPPPPSPTPTPTPPHNNDFGNAQVISNCWGGVMGTNVGANKEAGEPSHSPDGNAGGGSVWYQWTAPASTSVTVKTAGSNYDTLLAVYTGNAVNNLTVVLQPDGTPAKNDDVDTQGGNVTSIVTFTATAGTLYRIAVDGWGGERGNITLDWNQSNCSTAKVDQFISFEAPRNKTFGDPSFNVTATASSGLPVSLSIVSGPGTISGNTVTLVGTGIVSIRASQAGNATYNAAPFIDQHITVAKANQTITFNALPDKTTQDAPFNVSANSSSGLPIGFSIVSGPATISGNTITITGVGVVTVRASQQGDANFNEAAFVDRSFAVDKANQTITFSSPGDKIFGDAPFNVSATASSGLPVSFSIVSGAATISGNTVTITAAGQVTVRASQGGDSDFNAANLDRTFTVTKANQTITFNSLPSKTFGDSPFPVAASASSGLPVSFEIVSGPATNSGNTVTITGTGLVTVRARQTGDTNYNAAPFVDRAFNVVSANANITLSNLAHVYNSSAKFATVTTNPAGLSVTITYNNGSISSPTNAGEYNVTATINDPNFQGSTTGTLVINKATPVITWNAPATMIFGSALGNAQFNATANIPGSFQYSPATGTVLSVGVYQLSTIFVPSDVANYLSVSANVQLTVGALLLLEEGTTRAVALDSITLVGGPFPLNALHNFSSDKITRVMLFTTNLGLNPGDNLSELSVHLQGVPLQIERVGSLPGGNQVSFVVVKLPTGLATGETQVNFTFRGVTSNTATIGISP